MLHPLEAVTLEVLRLEKMWPKYLDLSEEECLGILRKLGNYILYFKLDMYSEYVGHNM